MDFFKTIYDFQTFIDTLLDTIWDVLPIAVVLIAFQWLVIRKQPPNAKRLFLGFLFVLLGLAFFLEGLEMALFPLGKLMAQQLTNPEFLRAGAEYTLESLSWQDYLWVYVFGAAIGFACTIAEPALIAVSYQAEKVSAGAISSLGLRIAVAIGAGTGIALGTFRIVTGTPLHYFIIGAYIIVIVQTLFAPRIISALAYDSGGVTTSTITVPVVAALGLGLATTIPGRSALLDGFGLIALTALFPIITVLGYGQIFQLWARFHARVETPLHKAAFAGDLGLTERLIGEGSQVNTRGPDDATPLHRAAFKGHAAVAELLLDRGAKINVKNDEGRTPLHRAAFKGHAAVAELLLNRGAKVNVKDKEGRTPLHRAAFAGHKAVAQMLLNRGAEVNAKNAEGRTPLHRAAFKGHAAVAELLLASGADINAKDRNGWTPLHRAAFNGHRAVSELLLAHGANVNAKDKQGNTPLQLAAYHGHSTMSELYVAYGADLSTEKMFDRR